MKEVLLMFPALKRWMRRLTYRPKIYVVRGSLYHRVIKHTSGNTLFAPDRAELFTDIAVPPPFDDGDVTHRPTALELPIVTDDAFLLDRALSDEPTRPMAINRAPSSLLTDTQTQFLALHEIEIGPRHMRETMVMPLRIISYTDKKNRIPLETLIGRAIRRHVKVNGALPTHLVVNALRLMNERPEIAWEIYRYPTTTGEIAIHIQATSRCPWNIARAYIETQGKRRYAS
jgi:hypothetical protein